MFLNRAFTAAEQQSGSVHHYPSAYYAMTFAAKEAVFKLFGSDWGNEAGLLDIEIHRGQYGEPLVKLNGRFAQLASSRANAKVFLSLSYDDNIAIAVAALGHVFIYEVPDDPG